MGIILGVVIIILLLIWLISFIEFSETKDFKKAKRCGLISSIPLSVVAATVMIGVIGGSYNSYLDVRSFYDATIEQYQGAVTMYKKNAVIDVKKAATLSFTDFKYQGYQKEMAEFIRVLRKKIVAYNETFVKKKVMNDNWIFDWIIIAPDDNMKIIQILIKE